MQELKQANTTDGKAGARILRLIRGFADSRFRHCSEERDEPKSNS
jgi:hypothetical protein